MDPDRNNFAPRVGFAWSITEKTVVRGGYGTSYVHFQRAGSGNLLMINGPQVINAVVSQSNPTAPAFRPAEAGYPEGITDPSTFNPLVANVTYVPRDHQSAEVHSWFLAVQREVYHGALVDVAYVENRGRNMLLFANYNQASPNNAQGSSRSRRAARSRDGATSPTPSTAASPSTGRCSCAFESRLKFGLVLLSSFTWSRALDNAAGPLEGANGDIPAPQDVHNLAADYGYSAYDQPYNSTTSLVWELPVGSGRRFMNGASGVGEALLGGWQVSVIFAAWSGERINLRYTPRRGLPGVRDHTALPRRQRLSAAT